MNRLALSSSTLVLAGLTSLAVASPPVEPWLDQPFAVEPAAALSAAEKLSPEGETSGVHVLLDESKVVFDAEGRRVTTTRHVFLLLKAEAAEEWGTVEAEWKPWKDEPPVLRARVIRKNGTVLTLDPSTVADRPLSSGEDIFDDRRERSAPLPGLEAGALVETETVEKESRAFPGGSHGAFSLRNQLPTQRMRFILEAPAALSVKTAVRGDGKPSAREETVGGIIRRTWERAALPADTETEWEWGAPSDVVQGLYVEYATGTSWGDIAAFYGQVVDEKLSKSDLKPLAKAADPNGLLAVVQKEIRYTSITFGDSAIIPAAPPAVLARKYGDCKDQATLLVGLLRARGFDASVALLRAGTGLDVDPGLPALANFNHAIVKVEGSPAVWIDPTSPFHRAGELPSSDEGRWALVCRKGRTSLEKTPESSAAANTEASRIEIHLPLDGKGSVKEVVEATGRLEAALRSTYDGGDEKARKKSFERSVEASYAKAVLKSFDVPSSRDLTKPFRVTVSAEKSGVAITTDADAAFGANRSSILSHLPSGSEKKRRLDLATLPFTETTAYHVIPPPGYELRTAPEDGRRELGPAVLTTATEKRPDGSIVVTLSLALDRRRLTPDEVVAIHKARQELQGEGTLLVLFENRVEAAVNAGTFREAFHELDAQAAAAPRSADVKRRLSRALLAAGLGDAARRAAEEATVLDPKSARAFHQLGMTYQHDRFGRLRRKGWEPAKADEALAKAVALDGSNVEIGVDQAILFEFDSRARRYRDKARLEKALTAYRRLLDGREGNVFLMKNTLVALLFAGRTAEVDELLKKEGRQEKFAEIQVSSWTLGGGVEKAIAEGRRRFTDPAKRREALEAASSQLVLLRRYDAAAALAREAAKGSPRAGELSARADLLARVKPIVEGGKPGSDPVSVVRALVESFFDDPMEGGERIKELFAEPLRKSLGTAEMKMMVEGLQSTGKMKGVPLELAADIATSAAEYLSEGDESTGWKVKANFVVPGVPPGGPVFWLTKEAGGPRVVGTEGFGSTFAVVALDLLAKGDLTGARRWLNRVQDFEREVTPRRDQDPLEGSLFPRFYTALMPLDARGITLACAALLVDLDPLAPALMTAVKEAYEEKPDDAARAALWQRALTRHKREAEALSVVKAARRADPGSRYWIGAEAMFLMGLSRAGEAEEAARTYLSQRPSQVDAKRLLSAVLSARGKLDEAAALLAEVLKSPDALPEDANNAAWYRLVAGRTDAEAIALARRAVQWEQRRSPSTLNTLAALLADDGSGAEAFGLVTESLDIAGVDEPPPSDWFVLGRIYESYGLVDEARLAYGRAQKEKDLAVTSTTALARKRLLGLKKKV